MSTALPSLVRAYQTLEALDVVTTDLPAQIAAGLVDKHWRLIDVVKELGEVLVSDVDADRARGVSLLSAVVCAADKSALDRQSTKTLATFFTDKLADAHSLLASVVALTALTEGPSFGVGEGMEVTRAVFATIKLQLHPQSTRFLVYSLLDALMSRSRAALKRLGREFIKGYAALAEGEKDPRNLMMSFSIIRVVLVEFDIEGCIDDLFDVTFCYFPITFTPPADDPYGISSEDLVVALRNCLAATPRFGTLALPLFLDKMQAASEKAKRQTLQALTACFPVYGAAVCGDWAGRFSEALSIEVFHASDDGTLELALTTFQSLFATLYPDLSPMPMPTDDASMVVEQPRLTGIEGIGIKVIANSLDELREPDKSNARPAARILAALLVSSNRLAHYILAKALVQLLTLYKDPDEISLRAPVITSISILLAAVAPVTVASTSAFVPPPLSHLNGESPLEPFRDDLVGIFTSSSRSAFSRPPAMEGLVDLVKIEGFLTPDEVGYCVSALNDILNAAESDDEYATALDGLVTISKLHPLIIESSTLPLLFAQLPATAPHSTTKESQAYRRALESLASLCVHPDLFETLSVRLVARLEGVCAASFADATEQSANGLYTHHMLATLRAVLRAKVANGDLDVGKYVAKFLPRLFGIFLLPTMETMDQGEVARDRRLLADVGSVVAAILQRVDVARQSTFLAALNAAFYDGDLSLLLGDQAPDMSSSLPFLPLSSTSPTCQQNLIVLFSSALVAMRAAVVVSPTELPTLLSSLLDRLLSAQNDAQLRAALHLLGATINKRAPDIEAYLTTELPACWQKVVDPTSTAEHRKLALQAWTWIAKGLVVRSDQRGYDAVAKILELFDDPALGDSAAAALGVIADESDRVLSKENFAVIRLLYKQRFFTYLLPKLVAGHKATAGSDRPVHLVALSCLLQHIPHQMSLTELPKLLPLLITALDLPDPALRANVIETLGVLAKAVPAEMSGSVSGIVLKVLKGLRGDEAMTASAVVTSKLRLASLEYLAVLPAHIGYSILHPQKAFVIKELGHAVDDPRRAVRRAAVDCRSKWFLYMG